jgi:DNA-binding MarR family transcriptional regulator
MVLGKGQPNGTAQGDLGLFELPDRLGGQIGFVLNKAARQLHAMFTESLEPLGIKPQHYAVLVLLDASGPLSQQAIGQRLYIDRTTMVHIVDDLEKRGLAVRAKNPADRRKHAVSITEPARKVVAEAGRMADSVQEQYLAPLSQNERRQLLQLLKRLLRP